MGPFRTLRPARRRPPLLGGTPKGALRAATRRPAVLGGKPKGPLAAIARPSWKLVGLAGVAGVAATGVVVARNRRAHRDLPPDELRDRLHQRLAEVSPNADGDASPA
jgi:hypothetical protein